MKITNVGDGKVVLIAAGDRVYTDMAAKFCHTEKDLDEIIGSEYNKNIVRNILSAGHLTATEFDYFIFGVEGYSRVTEAQLIRKRHANYLIKSGRCEKHGNRRLDVVIPESITELTANIPIQVQHPLPDDDRVDCMTINYMTILGMIDALYSAGVKQGCPEEDLRYIKPQATEFKAIVGMNAHALIDWFGIRMCKNAQAEIRDMATKMHKICMDVAPDLFAGSGPNCVRLGYCPENKFQNAGCLGKVMQKDDAIKLIKEHQKI